MLQQTEGRVPAAAVLGCTHYPLVAHLFRAALPASVLLLDQPEVVADSLADYLARHRHFAADVGEADRRRFLTSGDPRSEEHTSELQSLMRISYAVFCLKKKKNTRKRA